MGSAPFLKIMLRNNEIFDNSYQVIKEIGRGGTGIIYLAFHLRLRKYVVLKRICTNFGDVAALRRETDILKNLHHPYLPQVYDFIVRDGEVYTVMDYIEGTDFEHLPVGVGNVNEKQAMRWFRQLAEVLDYLHTRRDMIIHSDIKPGNILLTQEGNICLIDFNISIGSNRMEKVLGYSANYASPEQMAMANAVINRVPCDFELDERSDIYSAAATFYYYLTGQQPVTGALNPPLTKWIGLPYEPAFMTVIDKAMSFDREKRYRTAKKLLNALEHLKKQDVRYKKYLAIQVCSYLLCGVIAACGAYCLTRGLQEQKMQDYLADFREFHQISETDDFQRLADVGIALLNKSDYRGILQDRSGDMAAILHTVGDAYYQMEDFEGAREYYGEAVSCAVKNDRNLAEYYLDYDLALLLCGRTVEARLMEEKVSEAGLDTAVTKLIQAQRNSHSGMEQECIELVQTVLDSDAGNDLKARSCMIAAELSGNTLKEKLQWLEMAQSFEESRDGLRMMARIGLRLYQQSGKAEDGQKALQSMELLCADRKGSITDRINLGITQYVLGRDSDAIRTLKELQMNGSSDYRIDAYIALASWNRGDTGEAATYCSSALRKIKEYNKINQNKAEQELMDDLIWLQNQLGI